jgi:hypothetical protein
VAFELQGDIHALDRWVKRALQGRPDWAELLLFVDQFEELFTLVATAYQGAFIDLLARATRLDRVRTIVTLRADFYPRCLEWPALRAQFETEQLAQSHYPLMAPGMGQLHEMITRPAERAGLRFEEGLAERILDDTGTEPGALALMAFALAELYTAGTAARRLTHAAYESFEGVVGALGKRADDTFNRLQSHVQARLGDVFRELVEVDERGVATRRRALQQKLTVSTETNALVKAFTDARLLVSSRGEAGASVVEVAHEALFRSWPYLTRWIQATADDLRLRRHITQLAAYWQEHGCLAEQRWPDDRVIEAADMLAHLGLKAQDLPKLERDFLGPLDRERMLKQIDDPATTHGQRAIIGVRLARLGDPRSGVGLRADGLPDIVWCEVPPGEMALEEDAGSFTIDAPFYIAKYPLTYAQYRAFLDAPDGFSRPAWWQGLWFQVDKPGRQFNRRDNHPAENVCWLEAVAFCRWLTEQLAHELRERFGEGYVIRLPAEWEWQQAATGGDRAHEYPWGPQWDSTRTNTIESELSRSTAVGMYPQGTSPVGASDMSGNVWEWCLNEYDLPTHTDLAGEARRVVRGGSWDNVRDDARAAYRYRYDPDYRNVNLGVRLVCSSPIF